MSLRCLRPLLRGARSLLIILFFFWHTGAVAIYAIPSIATDPLSTFLRLHASPIVRPYILLTSQWQQWNLFAPDPLRRVIHYHLQQRDPTSNIWTDKTIFRPGTFSWWQHAARFKILDRIFDLENRDRNVPLQTNFLEKMCPEFLLHPGTSIRMIFRYYIIPHIPDLISFTWWRQWQPTWYTVEGPFTSCP